MRKPIKTNFQKLFLFSLLFLLIFTGCAGTKDKSAQAALELDSRVYTGRLDNGLTYFVRENKKPEGRASLRLVVRAGSILEADDQQGFAHLAEHMAFNGTANFEKMEMVKYLESIGMAFGPEVNAYTSFDETVYMLEIPTDDPGVIDTAFQILEDWAHLVSFENEEIEKERGVVREEWRLRRGSMGRIQDELFPALFKGSRYADRLPIGKMDVVMNSPAQRLRDFYHDWYRPELMAVIAVGDFDAPHMIRKIEEKFSFVPGDNAGPVRENFLLPRNRDAQAVVITDPEYPAASFHFYIKTDFFRLESLEDYRAYLIKNLFWQAFNQRLDDLVKTGQAPFLAGQGGDDILVQSSNAIVFSASLDPQNQLAGIEALLMEAVRAQSFGINSGELARAKANLLAFINTYYQDRENIKSPAYAEEIQAYYLYNLAMPGIEKEWEIYRSLIPEIGLEEINRYAGEILPGEGRVMTLISSGAEGLSVPKEQDLLDLLAEAPSWEVDAYADEFEETDLVKELPSPGKIIREEYLEGKETRVLTLSNGAQVVYKKTDFMADQILFYAYSPGGLSLVPETESHMARYSPVFLAETGLGDFSASELNKVLAGKRLQLSLSLDSYFETFSGRTTPADLETFFELVYLHFAAPRFRQDAFDLVKARLAPSAAMRLSDPETVYQDRLTEILSRGAYRSRPLDPEILAAMEMETVGRLFSERYASPGDFIFFFVGNLDEETLRDLAEKYLASLPAPANQESWKDMGIRPPHGVIDETIYLGLEPKAQVSLVFSSAGELSRNERLVMEAAAGIVETRLREILREELSGTYGVRVWSSYTDVPQAASQTRISFGCDPGRTGELSGQVMSFLAEAKDTGVPEIYLLNAKEQFRRSRELSLKENSYWLSHLVSAFQDGQPERPVVGPEDLGGILDAESFKAICRKIFPADRYVRLVLEPGEL